jgi:monothiol glutaredoxin
MLPTYETVDVLASSEVRDGIKEYSEWPTIPQLYVGGAFVGGCDIVKEMTASGDLAKLLGSPAGDAPDAALPTITISPVAAKALLEARAAEGEDLHLEIDARYQYGLFFGPREAREITVEVDGIVVAMSRATARRADGLTIDFVEGPNAGFKIQSPHEPAKVKQISPKELQAMIDRGDTIEVFDVRTPREREVAVLPFATLLDASAEKHITTLPRDATLVFHCHHGGRSQRAAEHFLGLGFTKVHNLAGGIDAWSQTIDPAVPRY